MSEYNERKTTGMTLLRHLAVRKGLAKKRNPNGIVSITVGDAEQIIEDFKQMKKERDEALAMLKLPKVPKKEKQVAKQETPKVAPYWENVIKNWK